MKKNLSTIEEWVVSFEDTEVWEDVVGFEGKYQVSNLGNVRSIRREVVYKNGKIGHFCGRVLKPINRHGYHCVHLYSQGMCVTALIHRLVCQAFSDDFKVAQQANDKIKHKNGIKTDNRIVNLDYVEASNIKNRKNAILTKQQVIFIRRHYDKNNKYYNKKALSLMFAVHVNTIIAVINNKTWKNIEVVLTENDYVMNKYGY